MAYNNGIDGKALLDEISKVIDAAANQYHEAGEDAGEEYVKGVVDGIKKHSKDAKSEIAKLYEDFNKTTNNFKSRKSVTQAEWTRVLGLSKELMKSERYANSVKEKLSDISVTFKNGVNVSGLEKVLEEWSKVGGLVESVSWSETSKNYKKRTGARKTKAETPDVNVDPVPVVKAEVKKQEAIVDTTKKINEQTDALRKQEAAVNDVASAQEKYNQRMSEIKDKYSGDINKQKQLISNQEAWIKYLNGSLDESKFKTTGKKAATDQLRSLTHYMTNSRLNNYKNDPGQYPKEMAEVAWMRGYQEAERQGVADSVLKRFDTDARYNFDKNLKTLQDEYDYRKKAMDDAYAKLQRLYLERDKEGFAAFADHLMPDGPQSDEESRILSEITEQVANKTLDYGDAKANLEKSIMTLRNMASSEAKVNLQNLVNDLKKTYDTETFDKVFGADFNMFAGFDKIDDAGAKELYDMLIESNKEYQASLVKTTDAQKEFSKQVKDNNLLYHAGDLSNPSKTQKTYPLGHVRPSKSGGIFNGFTGLYTTEDVDGFWGNEWSGAPISTIDASQYKLFNARTDELATKAKEFFNSLNGTIYGYIEDFSTGEIKKITDVKSIDELWVNFKEVFKNTDMTFEKFSDFVKKAQSLVSGKNFDFVDGLPDLDEGIVKTGEKSALQGVSKEVFNSDSFQTQLLKMLGFEGIDLRGTKHNGTYTGGTVIFDVKPESIKTTNEKWSDVMASHGYEIDEADLAREEKRRQLAFDTAKAYSQQADAIQEFTAQDRLVKVESELEAKKSRNKDLAAETEQVEKEFDNILTQHGVKTRFLGQGRFIDPDHLHEAYKGQSLAFADRKGVGDSDIAQALYQIARFPEKYGGTRISEEEGRQYYGDKRVNADAIIPFGDGRRVLFGTGVQYIGGPYKRNDQAIPKTINDNNDVIASSNGGYVSYEAMAKNPKLYLGMSEDELKQLPIIKRAYNDYQTQLDEDNVIRTLLHNLGNSAPEHIDILRPLFDKLSGLRQEQLQNQESIARLTEERQTIEQEISLESQPNHDKTEEILAQVEAQKQLNQVQQEQQNIQSKNVADQTKEENHDTKLFEDENGQVALFDGISSSVQQATEDTKELKNELKSIEILEGQIGIDDYKATAAQDALETPSDELKETFDIIQQGESVTGKFVTTANTVHEALRKMKDALPEDKQAWGEYIDNMLSIDDDLLVDTFKSIGGSMGGHSERYDIENLGDGRVAVTFAGIREEIEATTDAVEQSEKSLQDVLELIDKMSSESGDSDAFNKRHKALIDKANNLTSGVDYDQLYSQLIENENKYQQEIEETNRINKEREGQLEAYAQAAGSFLGDSKYDGVSFDDKNKLFENFGNKIMQDGLSASDAMDQLYLSIEKLIQQSKEMPDDVIESFGAENEHVAETVSQLQKLSSIDLTRIFDSVDLKSFLQAFNIDQSNFATFRKLFEELMQITNAMANGVDVGNAFNSKMDEITNTIMHLGGHMVDLDDAGYSSMMQEFYKHMSNTKVQFNDTIKADYTKDQWKSLYGTYKNRLTADLTKGISADSLYHELSGLFPSLFPEGVLSQQDQFKLIFDKLDEARKLQANNWKTLQGFASSDRDDIQIGVDNMFNQMSDALYADSSAGELSKEADAFKEVEQSATKAANAKGKFSKKNKELGDGAAESSDDLDDEAESLENVNRAAANMPDVSAYDSTSVRIGADGRPYSISGTATMEAVDGSHVRTTDTYSFNEDSNRWDYDGSVQSTERTREMVQALEEYYQILNRIQKLRLNTSDAIHTEEINKLETDDLVRAYQRVLDLGIQVNDIEGQINLSVNQRQALLDVELRARQEMYDVIAKMEDKQATTAAKPYQKTVRDELKKSADIDTNVRLLGDDGVSDRLQAQITDYRRLVDELVEMRLQLARNSDLANDVDFSNRFADTAKRAQNARVAIEGVFKESQKLSKLGTLIATDSNDVSRLENLKTAMIEFASSALDGEAKINGFNKEGTEMYVTLNQGADAVQNITVALDKATGHLKAFSTGTDKATNEWEEFKTQAVQGAKNLVGMYVGFQEGVQALRTGVNYVKEIDLAMTELKKVTDETDESYKQFLEDAGSTSAIIGSTVRDFTEATSTFARLGYSMEEASSMAETAIIYKNVADGLDTVEESSESIISTMMAFGIEANDTMSIIDRFNAVGKLYADYKVA